MGKTFTAIGIVQETHVMEGNVAIVVYDTRDSKMRTIKILKKDFENGFSNRLADGTKLEMIINAKTDEVERVNKVIKNWISTVKDKIKPMTEYNYRHDYA